MQSNSTLNFKCMFKKSVISLALIGVVAFGLASSGGGGGKKSTKAVNGLSLVKSGNNLRLSMRSTHSPLSGSKLNASQEMIKAYRKGSIFYILPTSYPAGTVSVPAVSNNLNALHLKIRMGK